MTWLIYRDFNRIIDNSKNIGGKDRLVKQLVEFGGVLDHCTLKDMGYQGPKYIWYTNKEGSSSICVRLDRFLANA